MAWKVSHLVFTILWLSLLLLLLHEFNNFKFKINSKQTSSITFSSFSHNPLISRKVGASKFDFTPFQKHHQQEQAKHPPNMKKQSELADKEIDPRYGVEKRLVPTGPNPLHH
ncbi:CLAVATA3/ESR (CLE)-related protein 12-like [Durio zibethinus]|uniref:CLAVATA3/ESR (CLE)-related protein 12-like n=1 Tax=Durio zibethinus TaxID=66656 RepID=A0A6P6BFB8_DURZI|nr:CLAVATA3/ESR (CLE)-related protein 12-like [Durio zibethinus]